MSEATNNASVGQTGSAPLYASGPSANSFGGQPGATAKQDINPDDYVPKSVYEDLESKLGQQGEELGEYRKFLTEITPLLEELKKNPELVQYIAEGKVDEKLAKAIAEGRVEVKDAMQVAQAHSEVKKDLGKDYNKANPQDVERLIAEKVEKLDKKIAETEAKLSESVTDVEERRKFENSVNDFIESTDDFQQYAGEIEKFFEEHPDQFDIRTAYYAVKGRNMTKAEAAKAEELIAEERKRVAMNAGGGTSQAGALRVGEDAFETLVSHRGSPNRL